MESKKLAKMAVALKTCEVLHKEGKAIPCILLFQLVCLNRLLYSLRQNIKTRITLLKHCPYNTLITHY